MSFLNRFRKNSKDNGDAALEAQKSKENSLGATGGDPEVPTSSAAPPDLVPEVPSSASSASGGGGGGLEEDTGGEVDATAAMNITAEDEPAEDPERTRLESVVRQRDGAISALEKARHEKQEQLVSLEGELEKERLTQMKEALLHKIECERIKRQTANAEERLKCLETDMQDKAAIHEYANLIKGVAPKSGVDSQYIHKLQAQLQKAVEKMETTTAQMNALEVHSREVVDTLTAEISQLVEDRCRTELELRKQLEVLEGQKKDTHAEYEERIRENLRTLQALKAKATSQTTVEELEEELEETEAKLEELQRIQEKQQKTVGQLNKSLAAQEGVV
jgi:DNA repair exonuclease SbcCD ATPase subunit